MVIARSALLTFLIAAAACSDAAGPGGPRFVSISAGAFHACALSADGTAWCWGQNTYGALGDGDTTPSLVPVPVATATRFIAISAGFHHTCGLAANGAAWCWGINLNGQVGDGSWTNRLWPVPVAAMVAWRAVTAGEGHTCATSAAGGTACWGASLGPSSDGSVDPPRSTPTALAGTDLPLVSVGYEIACGLATTGAASCWGLQPPGVVLTNGKRATDTPTPVTASPVLATISAGHKHACGLDAAGAAWCWGLNGSGQVGDGSTDTAFAPVAVLGGHTFLGLDAHAPSHTCAVAADGNAWCWGANAAGQLGDGSLQPHHAPVAVAGGLRFATVSVGFHFTCGVAGDAVYCWGYGGLGQLGDGTASDHRVPTLIADPVAP